MAVSEVGCGHQMIVSGLVEVVPLTQGCIILSPLQGD